MKVLLIGSGGREHAMAWKLSQSKLLTQLYMAPGNPGMRQLGTCLPVSSDDFEGLSLLIDREHIAMVICGPEAPLAEGLMDYLSLRNPDLILIGPQKAGAMLESSKDFSKRLMIQHNIPTADYQSFSADQVLEAKQYAARLGLPVVIKADGLAAGKGVVIAQSLIEAEQEIDAMFSGRFGDASKTIVIEQFLKGIEFSVFILTNGEQYILLPEAKDYKKIGEGDSGPNTGGMGSVSPVPFVTPELMTRVKDRIIEPTLAGLREAGIPYQGFIFFGLILVGQDPYVIEYNCRMGDPETESVMIRLESDLLELCIRCHQGSLNEITAEVSQLHAATICLVSGGYPGSFEKGKKIENLPHTDQSQHLFFSGVQEREGILYSAGGRVIAVSCLGERQQDALESAQSLAESIQFDGKYYRRDIGFDLQ